MTVSARRGTTEYRVWANMLSRCSNESLECYANYGGRGITVCARWHTFENFLADMGARPRGTTLDRIDNDGNYEPSNCRWATRREQSLNSRRNRYLTHDGASLPVAEWAARLGIPQRILYHRLDYGWSVERVLREPYKPRGPYTRRSPRAT